MKLNPQEVDKILDDILQTKELLQDNIDKELITYQTVSHIKAMIARVFEDMKTKEYKVLKKEINEIYTILSI